MFYHSKDILIAERRREMIAAIQSSNPSLSLPEAEQIYEDTLNNRTTQCDARGDP